MTRTWMEIWRTGRGRERRVCTVEDVAGGCAVDVFKGDVCIYSAEYPTRDEAIRAAQDKALKRQLTTTLPPLDLSGSLHGCARAANSRRFAAA